MWPCSSEQGFLLCAPRQGALTIQQYFRGGEFVINGGNQLNMVAQESAQKLGSISRKEYDRARSGAERFQRLEMRVMGLLQIAQVALSTDGQ